MTPRATVIIGDSRAMPEVAADSVHLVVTSPPYWHLKDYGQPGQIGYGQSLHEYLKDLYRVWQECLRVLKPGRRLCINVGDQFARAAVYGRYKIIPLHAEIIGQCEALGFDYLGAIIWQKKTTMNPTGGANVMGSYPFPPNGLVELDYEFILLFKKPGKAEKIPREVKEASRLSKEEWKEYFSGHWHFGGARQIGHEAMFPEELPRRLIRMFSFVGETVLDPFLGSGTTVKVALEHGRNAIGYEIKKDFLKIVKKRLNIAENFLFNKDIQITVREDRKISFSPDGYLPILKEVTPKKDSMPQNMPLLQKVIRIIDENTLMLDDGRIVSFSGVTINRKEEALEYLKKNIYGKFVILKDCYENKNENKIMAKVYLKNKIFINAYLIKAGLGSPDKETLPSGAFSENRPDL